MPAASDLRLVVLISAGLALAACSSSENGHPGGEPTKETPPPAVPVPGPTVPPTPVRLILVDAGSADAGHPPETRR